MKSRSLRTEKRRQTKHKPASRAAFGGGNLNDVEMPTSAIASQRLESGIPIMELFHEVGLANSRQRSATAPFSKEVPTSTKNNTVR